MKKKLAVFLAALLVATGLTACGQKEEVSSEPAVTAKVAALKGPTSMGMVKMMADQKDAKEKNYEFTIGSSPDEIAPKFLKGEFDIVALPSNLASILYNKSQGKVQVLAINTLGILYLMENGDTVKSIEDLKGKTVYSSGKGAVPEYAFNYILKAKTTEYISWRRDLMQGKSFSDIDDIVDRVGRAILCGAYTLKNDTKEVYYIKLPSGHYLCKYDNGFTGWTVEPNKFTVSSESVEELKNSYPEYTDFISKEEVTSKPVRKEEKKVGFTISERIGKKDKRVKNFKRYDTDATSKKNGLRW